MAPGRCGADRPLNGPLDVLVVGAGPVGLTVALQAARHGARVHVVERRPGLPRPSRAMLLWPRTLEALAPLGVADQFEEHPAARLHAQVHLGHRQVEVALTDLLVPGSWRAPLMVRQADVEAVLHHAVTGAGIPLSTGTTLRGLRWHRDGMVAITESLHGQEETACRFVVGCDGADSTVRRLSAIPWRGRTYPQEAVLADLEVDADVDPRLAHIGVGRAGIGFLFPAGEHGGTWRLVATRGSTGAAVPPGQDGPPVSADELAAVLAGANLPAAVTRVAWSTRVRLQRRRAPTFRAGPVFLAGDAAHVVSPAGAQGMNTGLQDATNLGWKLAAAARQPASLEAETLLESYPAERQPVARQVGVLTDLFLRVESGSGPYAALLRRRILPAVAPLVPAALRLRPVPAAAALVLSQAWVSYPRSPLTREWGCSPLRRLRAGWRAPNVPLTVNGHTLLLRELTGDSRVLLLHGRDAAPPPVHHLPGVRVHRVDSWPATTVVGIRPDGYVGYRDDSGRAEPLRRWLHLVTCAAVPRT